MKFDSEIQTYILQRDSGRWPHKAPATRRFILPDNREMKIDDFAEHLKTIYPGLTGFPVHTLADEIQSVLNKNGRTMVHRGHKKSSFGKVQPLKFEVKPEDFGTYIVEFNGRELNLIKEKSPKTIRLSDL